MSPRTFVRLLLTTVIICTVACFTPNKKQDDPQALIEDVRALYLKGLAECEGSLTVLHAAAYRFDNSSARTYELRHAFFHARDAYKAIEAFVEYYNPLTAKALNGPNITEIEEEEASGKEIPAEGFQVIESEIFASERPNGSSIRERVAVMTSQLHRLRATASVIEPSTAQLVDLLKLQVARITSLGLAGFDSPEANNSLRESRAALEGLKPFISLLQENRKLTQVLNNSIAQFSSDSIQSVDKLTLIRDYLTPLSEALTTTVGKRELALLDKHRLYRPAATSIFATNAFNEQAFAKRPTTSAEQVTLGERLFFDPVLSIDQNRACVSCHLPEKAFSDGLRTSKATSTSVKIKRNAPALLNAAFQSKNFWDARVVFLEDQIREVVLNKNEMHGSFDHAIGTMKNDPEYVKQFNAAFGDGEMSEVKIRNAMAAYMRSLTSMDSRFDRYMRRETDQFSDMEKLGFNTFMGKAKCGTCHFAPIFNGTVPPTFNTTEIEVLGVPATSDTLHPVLDTDEGRSGIDKNRFHLRAFKTPTVRNAEITAPFMHNGAFASLEEVIEFYDRGGGLGLGLSVENQTLPGSKLQLTQREKSALIAFIKALTDTSKCSKPMLPKRSKLCKASY